MNSDNSEHATTSSLPRPAGRASGKKTWLYVAWFLALALMGGVLYALTYYSWVGNDDLGLSKLGCDHAVAFELSWKNYCWSYSHWNQRMGEAVAIFVCTAGKSWFNVLNPFFTLLTMLAVYKLATGSLAVNRKNLLLFVLTFIIFLYTAPEPNRCLFNTAATIAYTWMGFFWVVLLYAFTRRIHVYERSDASPFLRFGIRLALFAVGFCVGMNNECVMATLMAFIPCYLLFNKALVQRLCPAVANNGFLSGFLRQRPLAPYHYVALAGFAIGCAVFFASPALEIRAASQGAVPVNLTSVPYLERLAYWPRLMGDFLQATSFGWVVFVCALIVARIGLLFPNQPNFSALLHAVVRSVLFALASVFMASVYLAGAIPYWFAYMPSAILLVTACVMLLHAIYAWMPYGRLMVCLAAILLCCFGGKGIVDEIEFGRYARPYYKARVRAIADARQMGVCAVVKKLPFPLRNRFIFIERLIGDWERKQALKYYKVKGIYFED